MITKCLLTPIYIIVAIVKCAVDILSRLSTWIFGVLAGMMLLVTLLCYLFGLESGESIRHMLLSSGVMFLIPQIVSIISALLEVLTEVIGDHIK